MLKHLSAFLFGTLHLLLWIGINAENQSWTETIFLSNSMCLILKT